MGKCVKCGERISSVNTSQICKEYGTACLEDNSTDCLEFDVQETDNYDEMFYFCPECNENLDYEEVITSLNTPYSPNQENTSQDIEII